MNSMRLVKVIRESEDVFVMVVQTGEGSSHKERERWTYERSEFSSGKERSVSYTQIGREHS